MPVLRMQKVWNCTCYFVKFSWKSSVRKQISLDFECLHDFFLWKSIWKFRIFVQKTWKYRTIFYQKKSGNPNSSMGGGQNFSGIAHCNYSYDQKFDHCLQIAEQSDLWWQHVRIKGRTNPQTNQVGSVCFVLFVCSHLAKYFQIWIMTLFKPLIQNQTKNSKLNHQLRYRTI